MAATAALRTSFDSSFKAASPKLAENAARQACADVRYSTRLASAPGNDGKVKRVAMALETDTNHKDKTYTLQRCWCCFLYGD